MLWWEIAIVMEPLVQSRFAERERAQPVLQTALRPGPQPFGRHIASTGRNVSSLSPRGDGDVLVALSRKHIARGPAWERPGARPRTKSTQQLQHQICRFVRLLEGKEM